MNNLISVENLKFSYDAGGAFIIDGVSFKINHGETVSIMGPNGAGKSTLLLALVGILKDYSGSIEISGRKLKDFDEKTLYKTVNLVFQNPENQLFCDTVEEEILFALKNLGVSRDGAIEKLNFYAASLGLEKFMKLEPQHLSFGQKKRLALASVMVIEPEVLMLDEPSSNLDYSSKLKLIETLAGFKKTKIIVTQDIHFALAVSERLIYMENGSLIYDGGFDADNLKRKCGSIYKEISDFKGLAAARGL